VEAGWLGRNSHLSLLNYQVQLHQILDEKEKYLKREGEIESKGRGSI